MEEIQEEEEEWTGVAAAEEAQDSEEDEKEPERASDKPAESLQSTEADCEKDGKQQPQHGKHAGNGKQQGNTTKRGRRRQRSVKKPHGKADTKKVVPGWAEWKKHRELIGRERWNLEWFLESGLEVVEAGQGRGGECQYLSALVMADPDAWDLTDGRVKVKEESVDALRSAVAVWFEKHEKDTFQSGLSLREIALADFKGAGRSEKEKWKRYLSGIRNGHSGQWGDDCTLMALSGVFGRPVYTLSCGKDRRVRPYDVSAPFTWGDKIEGAPLLLAHVSDFHYCPVKVLEGGEWGFVISPAGRSPERRKNGKSLADRRLILQILGMDGKERGSENADRGDTPHRDQPALGPPKFAQREITNGQLKSDSGLSLDERIEKEQIRLGSRLGSQGRNHSFDQRPEISAASAPALPCNEPREEEAEVEACGLASRVVQGRISLFDQRPEEPDAPQPAVLQEVERPDQHRPERMVDMEELERAMTALHVWESDVMEVEEEEQRGDG